MRAYFAIFAWRIRPNGACDNPPAKKMNVEEFRDYCLSLPQSSEKMPFQAFNGAKSILAFYVEGKIFCFFDIDKFESCTLKCDSDIIDELKADYAAVGEPYNMNRRSWISIRFNDDMPDRKIEELVADSYDLVKRRKSARVKRNACSR